MDGLDCRNGKSAQKRKEKIIGIIATAAALAILSAWIFYVGGIAGRRASADCTAAYATPTEENVETAAGVSSGIVIEQSSRRVLFGQNERVKMPMASTTKVMTALVALESLPLDGKITVDRRAVGVEGSSIYLREGEIWSVEDLLYGLMLRSGNDAAEMLAIAACGSVESFVDRMNEKARAIGAEQTHFVNPHGLHNDDHYTTAYDLALISACALENETFAKIVGSKIYTVPANDTHPVHYFANKNKMLSSYEGANGIKTGFTTDAGRCLVSSAKREGMQLVTVVLNQPDMWQESMRRMDEAFGRYEIVRLGESGKEILSVGQGNKSAQIALEKDLIYPIERGETLNLDFTFVLDRDLQLPLQAGARVGRIDIYDGNHLLFSEKIVSMKEINDRGVLLMLTDLVGGWQIEHDGGEIKQVFGVMRRGIAQGGGQINRRG